MPQTDASYFTCSCRDVTHRRNVDREKNNINNNNKLKKTRCRPDSAHVTSYGDREIRAIERKARTCKLYLKNIPSTRSGFTYLTSPRQKKKKCFLLICGCFSLSPSLSLTPHLCLSLSPSPRLSLFPTQKLAFSVFCLSHTCTGSLSK